MIGVVEEKDTFLAAFALFSDRIAGEESWVSEIRREAISRFADLGFPTTGDEEWRKTSVAPIARTTFALAARPPAAASGLAAADLARLTFDAGKRSRLAFVNGWYAPDLSSIRSQPAGVKLCSLAEALAAHRDLVQPHLARHADYREHAFTALNTAFMQDGAFLFIPEGVALDETIHLVFISAPDPAGEASPAPLMIHPRNLLVVGRGSQVTLVESYAGAGRDLYFTNAVTEVAAGESAVIEHHKLQRESEAAFHIATLAAPLSLGSSLTSHSLSLGGGLVRNDVNVELSGEGAECTLNGLYMTEGRQHVDNHTTIDHVKPHCASRELYKGILDGRSRAVFNGKIIVRPDARKTDSKQANRNLLLSEEALVDTKPELQIHNNDVKCTHAAAIGQLDEAAMFYLRSRGLSREAARSLLIHAFASDIVGRIKLAPLRDALENLLMARLPGYLGVKEAAL